MKLLMLFFNDLIDVKKNIQPNLNLLEPYFLLLESVLYCYDLQPRNFVRSNPKRHPFPFCAGMGQEVFNILLPI